MKRIVVKSLLLCIICALLPFQFNLRNAKADESGKIADGIYQIELSFQSVEGVDLSVFSREEVLLTIDEGRHTLALPLKKDNGILELTATQQDQRIITFLDAAENLVQFDIKDLHQMIKLDGMIRLPSDEEPLPFTVLIEMKIASLPTVEVPEVSKPVSPEGSPEMGKVPEKEAEIERVPVESTISKPSVVKKTTAAPVQSRSKVESTRPVQKPLVIPEEEQLVFDRTLDESIVEEENEIEAELVEESKTVQIVQEPVVATEVAPVNKVKVGLLVLAFVLSGFLLSRQVRNRKKV